MLLSGRGANVHFDDLVIAATLLDDMPGQIALGSLEPVPVGSALAERKQDAGTKEASAHDAHRIVRHRRPKLLCIGYFTRLLRTELSQLMRAKGHQGNQPHLGIPTSASDAIGRPEM
jgi:hypothetical protein